MPALKDGRNWLSNGVATALAVFAWGYFLYQGVVDPLGGINTLVAAIRHLEPDAGGDGALILATVVLFKMKRERYAWTTMLPAGWLLICTLTAGLEKDFRPRSEDRFHVPCVHLPIGPERWESMLAPAKSMAEMSRIVINDYVDTALCVPFVLVVVSMVSPASAQP